MGSPEAELSILFVADAEMADLNRQYLNRSGSTNVISFPMREGQFGHISPQLLGDVVISLDTAVKEAQKAHSTVEKRVDELLVHGILHLFGYDHETNSEDARVMEAKSCELLEMLRADDA